MSFPHVFKPHAAFEGQEAKFSLTMLFTKNTDLSQLKRAAQTAIIEKWGADKTKWPKNLRMPFRDGNEKQDLQGYENTIYVTTSSKMKPGIVDNQLNKIEDETVFYAGCYARATLIAFAYDKAGNKGVSFSLQNLQKLRDGESFSGRRQAETEFEVVEDGSNDAANYGATDESADDMFA